jgi:hypothetical protein
MHLGAGKVTFIAKREAIRTAQQRCLFQFHDDIGSLPLTMIHVKKTQLAFL